MVAGGNNSQAMVLGLGAKRTRHEEESSLPMGSRKRRASFRTKQMNQDQCISALQHEISVQKIAFSSLQGEHDKLLAAYSRSQTRASALEKKHNVSDAEIISLTEEKLRLQAQVVDLGGDVKGLSRRNASALQKRLSDTHTMLSGLAPLVDVEQPSNLSQSPLPQTSNSFSRPRSPLNESESLEIKNNKAPGPKDSVSYNAQMHSSPLNNASVYPEFSPSDMDVKIEGQSGRGKTAVVKLHNTISKDLTSGDEVCHAILFSNFARKTKPFRQRNSRSER
jgi:hypothetical protein